LKGRAQLDLLRLTTALLAALLFLGAPAAVSGERGAHDATTHRSFHDVEHWVTLFDAPERDEWQKPEAVVAALGLKPGMSVADLGAGTGYFARHLSAAVGATGTVFAGEVEPNLVAHLRKRAEEEGTANVVPVLASKDNPRLPSNSLDLILVVDTYHHFDDRLEYMRALQKTLRPGGRVVVIDWFKRELPEGPAPDHKLAREHVEGEMKKAGYRLIESPDFLPYQYFLVFSPED
jgi:ubiquinone/menaquinone biosynthesis C-methylase UbiE